MPTVLFIRIIDSNRTVTNIIIMIVILESITNNI